MLAAALSHYFLEDPWPVSVVLAIVALGFLIAWRRSRQPRWLYTAAAALILAVGVWVLAAAFVTPREEVIRSTRALLVAATKEHHSALDGLLAANAELTGPNDEFLKTRDDMLAIAGRLLELYEVDRNQIDALDATLQSPSRAQSIVRISSHGKFSLPGESIASEWTFTWTRGSDGVWRVTRLRCRSIAGRREITPEIFR